MLALGALVGTDRAVANGVDLERQLGRSGERIEVVGHDWLTCCPARTPVEHVALFLLRDSGRVLLLDVPASRDGTIQAGFTVPSLPAGRYRLEVCSRGPNLPGVSPGATCLPVEERFTVLAGRVANERASTPTFELAIGAATALAIVVVASVLLGRRSQVARGRR